MRSLANIGTRLSRVPRFRKKAAHRSNSVRAWPKRGNEMRKLTIGYLCLMAMSLCASGGPSNAQTIGYSGAVGQLATACGADIGKYCGKATLGGGRMSQCLEQNRRLDLAWLQGKPEPDAVPAWHAGAGARRGDANLPLRRRAPLPGRRGRRRQSDGMLLQGEGPLQCGVPESGRRCRLRGDDRCVRLDDPGQAELGRPHQQPARRRTGRHHIDGRAPAPDGAAKPERSGPRQPDEPRAFDRRA